jgi:hypothetical protein
VQNYNTTVRSFPTNFIAGIFGFAQRPFFTAQTGAERPPPIKSLTLRAAESRTSGEIRVYDAAGNVIETHEQTGCFRTLHALFKSRA